MLDNVQFLLCIVSITFAFNNQIWSVFNLEIKGCHFTVDNNHLNSMKSFIKICIIKLILNIIINITQINTLFINQKIFCFYKFGQYVPFYAQFCSPSEAVFFTFEETIHFPSTPMGYFNSPVSAHTFKDKILTTFNSFQEHRCNIIFTTSSCKEIQTIYTLTRDLQTLVTELSNQGWAIASCEIYFQDYSSAHG